MSDIDLFSDSGNPFDAIRQVRADGTEFWSARDLRPLMGYAAWQNFETPIRRAMKTAENQGMDVDTHFLGSHKVAASGPAAQDFELTRYGAYLVAMNGDPNIPEVAAAQHYFAVQTRVAETRPVVDGNSISRLELIEIARNAEMERLALESENRELAPKAEAFDAFLDATGKFNVGAVAKMLGKSQNWLFRELRNRHVFIATGGMRNTPYQRYMHHFEVIAHQFEKSNGELGCSYTTYVQPSGIDFIRRALGLPTIDPLPVGGAGA